MTDPVAEVLPISGPILVETASAVNQLGIDAMARGVTEFNLAGVTEADSAGVAVLLSWRREANARSITLHLRDIPASLHSLAAVYGVTDLIPQ